MQTINFQFNQKPTYARPCGAVIQNSSRTTHERSQQHLSYLEKTERKVSFQYQSFFESAYQELHQLKKINDLPFSCEIHDIQMSAERCACQLPLRECQWHSTPCLLLSTTDTVGTSGNQGLYSGSCPFQSLDGSFLSRPRNLLNLIYAYIQDEDRVNVVPMDLNW